MKTRSIFFSLLLAATAFAFLTNCSGNKKDDAAMESHDEHARKDSTEHTSGSTASEEAAEPQFQVDASFQQQLASVFTSYIELKDAFVSSDAGKVKTEANETNQVLAKIDMKLLSGAAHNDWMNYLSPIQESLKEISATSDIEAQRKSFSSLSDNLYKSVKAFGLGGMEAYYEFCPMAFNNEGAYWLSDQQQIRNPYFGDKMLTCGSVKEKLK
jgi:Cu(I)/Ag(I) efflux system membrane fusion protein